MRRRAYLITRRKDLLTGDILPASHDNSPTAEGGKDGSFKDAVAQLFSKNSQPADSVESDGADGAPTEALNAVPTDAETPANDAPVAEPEGAETSTKGEPAEDSAPATEAILLANGYEYVTEDTARNQTVEDGEDDSLTFSLMRNGEVVEKPTREERKADRAEAKAAAAAAKVAEQERAERLRVAQATIAAAAAAKAAQDAAERDKLAPILPTQSATSEDESKGMGSRSLFIGSAVLTAAAAVAAAVLILPNLGGSSGSEISVTTAEVTESATAPASSAEPSPTDSQPAPVPSFNTKVPTVTEQSAAAVEPVAPGTVEYVEQASVAPVVTQAPIETVPVETAAPVETEPAEAEPTAAPTAEASESAVELSLPTAPVTELAPDLPSIPVDPTTRALEVPAPAPTEGAASEAAQAEVTATAGEVTGG